MGGDTEEMGLGGGGGRMRRGGEEGLGVDVEEEEDGDNKGEGEGDKEAEERERDTEEAEARSAGVGMRVCRRPRGGVGAGGPLRRSACASASSTPAGGPARARMLPAVGTTAGCLQTGRTEGGCGGEEERGGAKAATGRRRGHGGRVVVKRRQRIEVSTRRWVRAGGCSDKVGTVGARRRARVEAGRDACGSAWEVGVAAVWRWGERVHGEGATARRQDGHAEQGAVARGLQGCDVRDAGRGMGGHGGMALKKWARRRSGGRGERGCRGMGSAGVEEGHSPGLDRRHTDGTRARSQCSGEAGWDGRGSADVGGGAGADDADAGVGEGAEGVAAVWGRDGTGDGRAEWTERRGGTERAWQRTGWVVWMWAGRWWKWAGARRVWEAGRASIGGGHGDKGKDGCGVGARAGTRGDVARAPAEWVTRGIRARQSENGARGGKPRTSFADGAEGKRIPQGGSGRRREAERPAVAKRDTSEAIGERAVCVRAACCIFSERLTEDGCRPSNWGRTRVTRVPPRLPQEAPTRERALGIASVGGHKRGGPSSARKKYMMPVGAEVRRTAEWEVAHGAGGRAGGGRCRVARTPPTKDADARVQEGAVQRGVEDPSAGQTLSATKSAAKRGGGGQEASYKEYGSVVPCGEGEDTGELDPPRLRPGRAADRGPQARPPSLAYADEVADKGDAAAEIEMEATRARADVDVGGGVCTA
ncbi:hypothetical protein B0H14DRAFT_3162130 [Mycena olivaceomarginata]|nr:hypothetical protein B0H14DRAFT_3162130 [Mycena olivaceomarginata]